MNSQIDSKWYSIVELRSGEKGICCYDRIEALKVAHKLNKKYPKGRYSICAV